MDPITWIVHTVFKNFQSNSSFAVKSGLNIELLWLKKIQLFFKINDSWFRIDGKNELVEIVTELNESDWWRKFPLENVIEREVFI